MVLQGHEMKRKAKNVQELYDAYGFGNFCYGSKREKHNTPLVAFLDTLTEKDTVYDIGCGQGFWLERCLERGLPKYQLWGVDLSPRTVNDLKARGFQASCDDILNLQVADNVSDFTICSGVIHATPDPFRAFTELVRITKPGGYIYLSVYNRLNPYHYLVHKATFPIRYLYWNGNKNIVNWVYPISKFIFQPLSYLVFGEFLDDKTGRTMFMDHVMAPYAHLSTKRSLKKFAEARNCDVIRATYFMGFLMIACVLRIPHVKST